jgi:SAM-dependent methyltransferase
LISCGAPNAWNRELSRLNPIFEFNQHNRDLFIRGVAEALPQGARVLDAGAGPCKYRPLFSHCRYESQDFGQYTGPDLKYGSIDHVCDITAIPIEEGSFDCVICTEVLEHVPQPERVIQELARILKPGGLLALTAPFTSGMHMAPYHYCAGFSPYWYQHFLPLSGMQLQSCTANGGFFKLYGQESRRFLYAVTPRNKLARLCFLPLKAVLALWFRLLVPVLCHYLDRLDTEPEQTTGYLVLARKNGAA